VSVHREEDNHDPHDDGEAIAEGRAAAGVPDEDEEHAGDRPEGHDLAPDRCRAARPLERVEAGVEEALRRRPAAIGHARAAHAARA
jgi:hypothetical protein